jgi:hypothetical protein
MEADQLFEQDGHAGNRHGNSRAQPVRHPARLLDHGGSNAKVRGPPMSTGWVDVAQIAVSIVTGFVSALVAVGVLTIRVANVIAILIARQDRLEGQHQMIISAATLQMERADTVNRQSIMETVEKVAVHPIGRLERSAFRSTHIRRF